MQINCLFKGRTPKESETITDCQDYLEVDEKKGCFAIADGASQSFYPSIWAELLVKKFSENPKINSTNWKVWLEKIQQEWFQEVNKRVETAKAQNKPSWIEGRNGINARRSATSTFIGLEFSEDKVKVCIVGDSCLFILNKESFLLESSYPLTRSQEFNNRPEYFASYPKDNDFKPRFFDIPMDSELSNNTYFILATDALSEYIIKCHEKSHEQVKDVFSRLVRISSKESFENFVANARHQNTIRMKNDDVALLILDINNNIPSSRENSSQGGYSSSLSKELNQNLAGLNFARKHNTITPSHVKLKKAISIALLVLFSFLAGMGIEKILSKKSTPKIIPLDSGRPIFEDKKLSAPIKN